MMDDHFLLPRVSGIRFLTLSSRHSNWHSEIRLKFSPNGGRFLTALRCSDLVFISSSVDEESKANSCTWSVGWTMHARWGHNEWVNWVFLLQKGSGLLICGARWKENGRGWPPKNIIQKLFCQAYLMVERAARVRKKVTEGTVSGLGWCEITGELNVSEREIRRNYIRVRFRTGTPCTSERMGGRWPVTQRRDVCLTGPVVASQHSNRLFAA